MGSIYYPQGASRDWVGQLELLKKRLKRDWTLTAFDPDNTDSALKGAIVCVPVPYEPESLNRIMAAGCRVVIEFHDTEHLISHLPDIGRIVSSSDPELVVITATRTGYNAQMAHLLTNALQSRKVVGEQKASDVEMSLHEILANSLIHGNLELSSALRREAESFADYITLLETHLADDSLALRPILIATRRIRDDLQVIVRDCGRGFDPEDVEPIRWEQASGRGIDIARALSRKISYSQGGRQVQLDYSLRESDAETGAATASVSSEGTASVSSDKGPQEPVSADKQNPTTKQAAKPSPVPTVSAVDEVPSAGSRDILDAKILVIEDTDLNRRIIDGFLKAGGFKHITMAVDGLEGLEKIKEVDPDIVILDIVMPRMDGFGVLEAVRTDSEYAQWRDLPILVQTAIEEPQQRGKVFNVGATDLVSKPIHKLELVSRVQIHLENRNLIRDLVSYQSRTEEELSAAKAMQIGIMPSQERMQQVKDKYGITLNAHFETSSELGGDFWGVHDIDDDRLGFFIVDFSGHGVTAALNTFRLHTLMSEVARDIHDPAEYMEELNRRLVPLLSISQFCTMIYGVFDTASKTLTYSGAAAPEPILVDVEQKSAEMLDASGIPMGVIKSAKYETRSIPFGGNSAIFFYSDALTETLLHGKAWEEEGLMSEVCEVIQNPNSDEWLDDVLGRFFAKATRPLPDDLTVVAFTP